MALISKATTGKTVSQSERERNLQVLRTIRDSPDSTSKERMDAVAKLERIDQVDEADHGPGALIDFRLLSPDEFSLVSSLLRKATARKGV